MTQPEIWSLYILRCADNSLYTGISPNVAQRIRTHELGRGGARYLRGRGPLRLVFQQPVGDRSLASKLEWRVKRLDRATKEQLLTSTALFDELLNNCRTAVSTEK